MVALKILGIIALIVFLFCLIPIGADIAYEQGELVVSAKVCGVLLQLIPKTGEPKPKKPKKEKKPKPEKEEPEKPKKPKKKPKLDFTKEELFALVKAVLRGLGKFRKIKVDRFLLHWLFAGRDPYYVACDFGYVNAALSALAPMCRERFAVKECSVKTAVDFTADWMHIDFGIALSIRIGQIFGVINTILFGALWILIKHAFSGAIQKVRKKFSREERQAETTEEAKPAEAAPENNEDKALSEDK